MVPRRPACGKRLRCDFSTYQDMVVVVVGVVEVIVGVVVAVVVVQGTTLPRFLVVGRCYTRIGKRSMVWKTRMQTGNMVPLGYSIQIRRRFFAMYVMISSHHPIAGVSPRPLSRASAPR